MAIQMDDPYLEDESLFYEPVRRLTADMRKAAETMSDAEVRYLIDLFYSTQEQRKRSDNQLRASSADQEPNSLTQYLAAQVDALEGICNGVLQTIARRTRTGRWCMGLKGISGVLTSGLLAQLDVRKAPSAASFWRFCFPPGTLIETTDGPVPIEAIEAGDRVIDAYGDMTAVQQIYERAVEELLISIKARGCLAIDATEEHPFLVRDADGHEAWMPAQTLEAGQYLGIPIPQPDPLPTPITFRPTGRAGGGAPMLREPLTVTEDLAWTLGYFVADGHATIYDEHGYRRGQCALTFGLHQEAYRQRATATLQHTFGSARLVQHAASAQLVFGRLTVAETFQALFGHRAHNKRIPALLMQHPDLEIVRQFLFGYFAGDGHVVKTGRSAGVMMANTVSRTLALQLQRLLLRFGIFATLYQQPRVGQMAIHGRIFRQQPWRYVLILRALDYARLQGQNAGESLSTNRRPVWTEHHVWTPIVSVEEEMYSGTVHNLETTTHTYIAENLAVHNCGQDPSWTWLGKEKAAKLYAQVVEDYDGRPRPQDLLDTLAKQVNTPVVGLLERVERQTRPRAAREAVRTLEEVHAALTRAQLVNALATRPWNAGLKTLIWKLMDCLVKVQNRDDAPYYCAIYQRRKVHEWTRNFAGDFHAQCSEALSRNLTALQRPWYSGQYDPEALRPQWQQGMSPSTWKLPAPEEGGVPMLPPGRIELRARRIGVKQFLADLHYCLHEEAYGTPPVPSAEQQARGTTHFRVPPGWAETT